MQLSPETARFVAEHRLENVRDLALKARRTDGLDLPLALDQIAGWQTARTKLPEWAACEGIIYPPHISMEQCSSEFTARYKASVARRVASQAADSPDAPDRSAAGPSLDTAQPIDGCLVDLTGGFGVDFSYMAREFAHAVYVERQEHLCELAEHNMRALGLDHVRVMNADAEALLGQGATGVRSPSRPAAASPLNRGGRGSASAMAGTTDVAGGGDSNGLLRSVSPTIAASDAPIALIFIDPARRDEHGGRTVAIEDCTPDVLALRDRLLAAAPHVMIKLSPMLDWRKAVADFHGAVSEVHIVSTGNECKELLLVLDRQTNAMVHVHCVNDGDVLVCRYDASTGALDGAALRPDQVPGSPIAAVASADGAPIDGVSTAPTVVPAGPTSLRSSRTLGLAPLPDPIAYLYEPNASIMKAGCFALVEDRYGVTQIGPNSHLFVSGASGGTGSAGKDRPVADFPGRRFAVETIATMGKKELKQALAGVTKANIAVRNFPLTVAALRKKLKLSDGGDVYLFATTLAGGKHVIVRCRKV
ncbi:SAM-dependent methyltransferase [Bifidobacterium amazonense]|uniref:SAM-dependent methyltransferase n=1 Tax=Bifidobacterium amazonense TaxID=2809027 RepID=A0ABS9VYJ4_9BIFI|nr:SAM-dependent methyltransferase [Bifidobacterium amazonense]MCH9277178.1 SAM-dependent methyltransferase [Bifidobacterium amazonense]